MSPAAFISVIRQVSSTTLPWSSMPVVLHLSLPSPSLKPPHQKPRHSAGLKTPTIAAPAIPETMPACQAAQAPSQPHLPPHQLTSPVQLPLQPPRHPRRHRAHTASSSKSGHRLLPPADRFPELRRVLLRRPPRDEALELARSAGGGERDTSANVSERGAGCCGRRITAAVWSQLDEVCIPLLELAFRDVRMQGSLVCSPEQARQILEAVAEHRVSVASNPFYGLEETLELVWLAQGGKMKGEEIAVVGREQRSDRSWRWVEMHCCPRFSDCDSWKGRV